MPSEIELQTLDQFHIIFAPEDELRNMGIMEASPAQLREMGVLPKLKFGEARSLVQRMKAKKAEEAQRQRRQSKRDRRREAKREMAEARARGEI